MSLAQSRSHSQSCPSFALGHQKLVISKLPTWTLRAGDEEDCVEEEKRKKVRVPEKRKYIQTINKKPFDVFFYLKNRSSHFYHLRSTFKTKYFLC